MNEDSIFPSLYMEISTSNLHVSIYQAQSSTGFWWEGEAVTHMLQQLQQENLTKHISSSTTLYQQSQMTAISAALTSHRGVSVINIAKDRHPKKKLFGLASFAKKSLGFL